MANREKAVEAVMFRRTSGVERAAFLVAAEAIMMAPETASFLVYVDQDYISHHLFRHVAPAR